MRIVSCAISVRVIDEKEIEDDDPSRVMLCNEVEPVFSSMNLHFESAITKLASSDGPGTEHCDLSVEMAAVVTAHGEANPIAHDSMVKQAYDLRMQRTRQFAACCVSLRAVNQAQPVRSDSISRCSCSSR